MMPYASAGAFRRALEDRLRNQDRLAGTPLAWLRKMIVFERFVARLVIDQPDNWALKGGLALQWRFPDRARTTKDRDVLLMSADRGPHVLLVQAASRDLGDWLEYSVQEPQGDPDARLPNGGLRFVVEARIGGRPFETFHLDVGCGDPVIEPFDHLTFRSLLEFAGVAPCAVPCYPLSQHVAEKVHAYARLRPSGESSRVKDLVDIVLIASTTPMRYEPLRAALHATYQSRNGAPPPSELPDPPAQWSRPFQILGRDVGLAFTLAEGIALAREFLLPVLQTHLADTWDPTTRCWGKA